MRPTVSGVLDKALANSALHRGECRILAYLIDRRVDDVHGMHLRVGPGSNALRVTKRDSGALREVQPDDDGRQALHQLSSRPPSIYHEPHAATTW